VAASLFGYKKDKFQDVVILLMSRFAELLTSRFDVLLTSGIDILLLLMSFPDDIGQNTMAYAVNSKIKVIVPAKILLFIIPHLEHRSIHCLGWVKIVQSYVYIFLTVILKMDDSLKMDESHPKESSIYYINFDFY
jgi:hypothetical protein